VSGIDDVVTGLLFNAVGAVIVAVWGTNHLNGLIGFIGNRLRTN
jgi:hypothetical protein